MEDFRLLIAIAVSTVYIGAVTRNTSLLSQKYYFILLANKWHYLVHIILAVLLSGFGVWRALQGSSNEILYMAPLLFLLQLKILNWCILKIYGRYLIIATRHDTITDPEYHPRLLDRLVLLLLILAPLLLPFWLLRFIR